MCCDFVFLFYFSFSILVARFLLSLFWNGFFLLLWIYAEYFRFCTVWTAPASFVPFDLILKISQKQHKIQMNSSRRQRILLEFLDVHSVLSIYIDSFLVDDVSLNTICCQEKLMRCEQSHFNVLGPYDLWLSVIKWIESLYYNNYSILILPFESRFSSFSLIKLINSDVSSCIRNFENDENTFILQCALICVRLFGGWWTKWIVSRKCSVVRCHSDF